VHLGLIKPAVLGTLPDGSLGEAHVINIYIHLLDATKRRTSVIKKSKEDKMAKKEVALKPKKPNYLVLLMTKILG
jgi:hypothetical protein